jgi:hypothetical protein
VTLTLIVWLVDPVLTTIFHVLPILAERGMRTVAWPFLSRAVALAVVPSGAGPWTRPEERTVPTSR